MTKSARKTVAGIKIMNTISTIYQNAATAFLAYLVISSNRSFFEFTIGFSYMILRSFVSIWKLETIVGEKMYLMKNEKLVFNFLVQFIHF